MKKIELVARPERLSQDGPDEPFSGRHKAVWPEGLDSQEVVDGLQVVIELLPLRAEVHGDVLRVGLPHPVAELGGVELVHDVLEGLGELVLQLLGTGGQHLDGLDPRGPHLDLLLASQHVLLETVSGPVTNSILVC